MVWTARHAELLLAGLGALVALVIIGLHVRHSFLWNESRSLPTGLYVRAGAPVRRDAIVTVRAREVAGEYASLRDFADADDRFIKRVAAVSGDVVCAEGETVTINGDRALPRASRDVAGRHLPTWSGCRTLRGEVLLLGDTPDSFDGRYWGPTPLSRIEGVWRHF